MALIRANNGGGGGGSVAITCDGFHIISANSTASFAIDSSKSYVVNVTGATNSDNRSSGAKIENGTLTMLYKGTAGATISLSNNTVRISPSSSIAYCYTYVQIG